MLVIYERKFTMSRIITVKGVGKASVRPDQVEIRMTLEAKDTDYDKAMAIAADQLNKLRTALEVAGFGNDCLKTTEFDVRAVYASVKDRHQNYTSVFDGYECSHELKLTFDFDTANLSAALAAIAKSSVNPKFYIDFTVKNPAAVNELVLKDATANARKKAEILCAASGVALGDLISIDYNWGEVSFVSRTKYDMVKCYSVCEDAAPTMNIDPEDIDAGDSATFIWEIK